MTLKMANGATVAATYSGTCRIVLPSGHVFVLYKTLYFDTANRNILSVHQMCKQGYTFMFDGCKCNIYLRNRLIGTGLNVNGLYILETNEINMTNTINEKRSRNELNSRLIWHHRLGHIGDKRIMKMGSDGLIGPLGSEPYPTCESCLQGKMTKSPFVGQGDRANEVLELIHTDVCGQFNEMAR